MAFWNRNVSKPIGPPASPPQAPPPPQPQIKELEALAKLIPERDPQENYLWQPYVSRIIQRLDGLPAPDGGGSFVSACLAAGCKAVPVIHRNTLWEKGLSEREWSGRYESDLARRVRLGLFFAASLRYLAHTLCRLRIKSEKGDWHPFGKRPLRAGEVRWRPLLEGVSFRELEAALEGRAQITWLDAAPSDAQVCAVAVSFLQPHDVWLLTPELTVDVLDCVMPRDSGGMLRYMLFSQGQIKPQRVDVAGLCVETLRQLSRSGRLRVNSNPGDLFVTPEVSFLVAPSAVDVLLEVLRRRGHSFTRTEVYRGLGDADCLVGAGPGAKRHTRLARLKSPAWQKAIRLRGLAITHAALWNVQRPPGYFDGTLTIQE